MMLHLDAALYATIHALQLSTDNTRTCTVVSVKLLVIGILILTL